MQDGDIVHEMSEPMARGQAERLVPALEEVLAHTGQSWGDLDAIGVGVGPGNFTGIRISVSAARGLALGLDIPAVGVSTLEAVALTAPRPVTAAASASRGGAFYQVFTADGAGPPGLEHAEGDVTGWQILAARSDRDSPVMAFDAPSDTSTETLTTQPDHSLVAGIARIAATRHTDPALPRPAPLYIRPADAAPSRDLPPVLLD